ncbi:hypothetical protein [Marinobacterium lutimaris]|uniref:Zinc protease n=1 Tax=Marinobacterium lutimaris TaxID=568106 RepID=A0A1H6D0P3_9GAMM|nr:hypothetical protein [Marinobacterium lutimaris]SEG78979.1 hypothetical protein SAMN05444390_104428 [Marinobacterium lutimaris]
MAESKSKPLFNRRYLLILVWVLPIVILLLQRGAGETPLDPLRWNSTLHAYELPLQQEGIDLGLLLPLPQTLTDQAWIDNRVSAQALQQRLSMTDMHDWLSERGWQAQLKESSTHLLVRLHMNKVPTAQQMKQFYSLLRRQERLNNAPLHQRAQAERYLQSQQDESRLLVALGEQLADTADTPTAALPTWILSGNIEPSEEDAPAPDARNRRSDISPMQLVLNASPRQPERNLVLTGQLQGAPRDGAELAQQRLAAELVAQLLPRLGGNSDYRWIWKPLAQNGYRALILPADAAASLQTPEQLGQAINEELLEQTRAALLERYDRIIDEAPQDWLELVALYRLPLDSHRAFRDTLNTIDLDAARALITNLFDPGHSLQIRFASTGNPS